MSGDEVAACSRKKVHAVLLPHAELLIHLTSSAAHGLSTVPALLVEFLLLASESGLLVLELAPSVLKLLWGLLRDRCFRSRVKSLRLPP